MEKRCRSFDDGWQVVRKDAANNNGVGVMQRKVPKHAMKFSAKMD
ncbi:MAG: hypothetical protein ABW007_16960 [Chitinophagaceae bacterium]